jgi:hypothetical protein
MSLVQIVESLFAKKQTKKMNKQEYEEVCKN